MVKGATGGKGEIEKCESGQDGFQFVCYEKKKKRERYVDRRLCVREKGGVDLLKQQAKRRKGVFRMS